MKKVVLLATILFAASISANAQEETPRFEFWGTYSLLTADIDVLDNESLHGYGFGAQGNVNRWFSLVGEFTSNHGASGPVTITVPGGVTVVVPELDTRVNYFLFGPRITYRTKPVNVFAHFLIGGANSKLDLEGTGIDETNTEFAFGIGGGIDVNLGKHFAIRAAQFDYAPVHTDINTRLTRGGTVSGGTSSWLHNVRFQAGGVIRF